MGNIPSEGGSSLVRASIALSILQIVFVAARFYTRYWQRMRCGADDYVILIALAGSLAKAIIYITLVKVAGLGYHFDDETHPAESIALIRKGFFVLEILDFPLTITPAKISLLLFYVRIFSTRKFQITAYVVGSIVLALGIAVFFQTIFQCSPIAYGWDSTIHHGKCIDQTLFYRVTSPINVVTGILILVMPMPLVWRIQAPRGQKVALTVVFVLGGVGFVASIRRMAIHFMDPKAELDNVTWFPVQLAIITVVEGAILIITGCLVTIWPLIIHLCPYRLVSALSCVPRARQQRCWYMMTQAPSTSEEQLTYVGRPRTQGQDGRGRSPSWADLEEQRWWVSIEGGSSPETCERVERINVDQGLKS